MCVFFSAFSVRCDAFSRLIVILRYQFDSPGLGRSIPLGLYNLNECVVLSLSLALSILSLFQLSRNYVYIEISYVSILQSIDSS